MRVMVFENERDFQAFLNSFSTPAALIGVSVQTAEGEMTYERILAEISKNAHWAFGLKNILAKSNGGLGNRKSVRRMTTEFIEIQSEKMKDELDEARDEYRKILDKFLDGGPEGVFSKIFNKIKALMNMQTKESEAKKMKEENKKKIMSICSEEIDAFIGRLDSISQRILSQCDPKEAENLKTHFDGTKKFAELQKNKL